jgi:hypothetical protein
MFHGDDTWVRACAPAWKFRGIVAFTPARTGVSQAAFVSSAVEWSWVLPILIRDWVLFALSGSRLLA